MNAPAQENGYAELCVTTNFTFLRGASHPEEYMARAAELGLSAIAITDRNSLAGVVRAFSAHKILARQAEEGVPIRSQHRTDPSSRQAEGHPENIAMPKAAPPPRLITGCRLALRDSAAEWLALPVDLAAYKRLAKLLTLGKRRAEKAGCDLGVEDMLAHCEGIILIAMPPPALSKAADDIQKLRRRFPGNVFLGAAPRYDGSDQAHFDACAQLAQRCSAPMVAVGDVLMHSASRRPLADVLTCMREGCAIDNIGARALPNAERRLKGRADMERLFHRYPAALRRTLEIASRCSFSLTELRYDYPDEGGEGGDAHGAAHPPGRRGAGPALSGWRAGTRPPVDAKRARRGGGAGLSGLFPHRP